MNIFQSRAPAPSLLTLPAELRESIFAFALTSSKPTVTFRLDSFQKESYQEAIQPSLTRVNRQIRREALPLFYQCNEFILHTEFPKAQDAERWLQCIKPHLMKVCRLALWVRYMPPADERSIPSGALSVSMVYDLRAGQRKALDQWRWVTANRKPADVDEDGTLLLRLLRELIITRLGGSVAVEDYVGMITDLKALYLKRKLR